MALTLGIPLATPLLEYVLMAAARPATVLLGLAGTVTGKLLTPMVLPAVNTGLALPAVMVPYTRF